jgi:hypothetical protein
LLITKDFDYSNIPTEKVEYQRIDGTWSKVQLYSSDFSSCENILACYEHFHEKAREHDWAGQMRFIKWRASLLPAARSIWTSVVAAGPNNYQAATFFLALRTVLSRVAGRGAYEHLKYYLDAAKKPRKMSSAELVARLGEIQTMSSYFLDENGDQGEEFTDAQMRSWFVKLHPNAFIENFNNAGKHSSTETMESLLEYMNTQASQESLSSSTKKRSSTSTDDNDKSKKQRTSSTTYYSRNDRNSRNGGRGGRGGRGGGRDGRGDGGRGRGGPDPNKKCPVHPQGNHLWRKCSNNPYADEDAPKLRYYRNMRIDGMSNPNSGRGSGQHQYNGASHQSSYFMNPTGSVGPGGTDRAMHDSTGRDRYDRGGRSDDHFYANNTPNFPGMSPSYSRRY